MNINSITNDIYTVGLEYNEQAYAYPLFCGNHQQALERAFAAHEDVQGPLPMGAHCLVHGPCHDAGCPLYGKILTIEGFTGPEGLRVTNYQHH